MVIQNIPSLALPSQPDGTTATTGNTGASQINGNSKWSSATARFGRNAIRQIAVSGQQTVVNRFSLTTPSLVYAITHNNLQIPDSNNGQTLWSLRATGTSGSRVLSIRWDTSGQLTLVPLSGSPIILAAAGVLSAGQLVDIPMYVKAATSTTGELIADVYAAGQSTSLGSVNRTNVDFGTTVFNEVDQGGSGISGTISYLLGQYEADRTTRIPVYSVANTPPVITLPARQIVASGATVTMPISTTDPENDNVTVSTTVVRLTRGAAPLTVLNAVAGFSPSWTAAAVPALDQVTVVATDANGASSTATTEYVVLQTGNFGVLNGGSLGAWSNTGGAANAGAAVADAVNTTFAESPDQTSTESEIRFRLEPIDARTTLQFKPQSQMNPVGGTNKFRVYNGNTKIGEWDITQSTSVVTNGAAASGADLWTIDGTGISAGAPLSIAWATVT